jgi:hypothetical protein
MPVKIPAAATSLAIPRTPLHQNIQPFTNPIHGPKISDAWNLKAPGAGLIFHSASGVF